MFRDVAFNIDEALRRLKINDITLTHILLGRQNINDHDVNNLTAALRGNTTVTWIDLDYNHISDIGGLSLVECLHNNTTIKSLILDQNRISDVGSIALEKFLCDNNILKCLDLASNYIGNEGAKGFSRTILVNETLEELFLDEKNIEDEEEIQLLESIHSNETITRLDVEGEHYGDIQIEINELIVWNERGALHPHNELKDLRIDFWGRVGQKSETLLLCCQDRRLFILLVLRHTPICDDFHWWIVGMLKVKDVVWSRDPRNVNTWK